MQVERNAVICISFDICIRFMYNIIIFSNISPGAGGEERCHMYFIGMLGWLVESRCVNAHLEVLGPVGLLFNEAL